MANAAINAHTSGGLITACSARRKGEWSADRPFQRLPAQDSNLE